MTLRLSAGLMLAGMAAMLAGTPAGAVVKVYTDKASFLAAIGGATTYTPVTNAAFGTSSYAFGPVTATAPEFETYTGDYGAGVRSLGAFLSPVDFTSTQTALGLDLGYYVGPAKATYTIDGVTRTVTVPAHPNTLFLGFTDDAPISVSFATNSAEFDTIDVIGGSALATPVPEAASWAMMALGFGMIGFAARRRGTILA